MSISIIAAISENNCIGKNGEIPWRISEDMKRVKQLTLGKVVIMGRKTWESLPEKFRPLPGRTNVVITRQHDFHVPEVVEVYYSIAQAIDNHKTEEIVGFGGFHIFEALLPLADTLYITRVHQIVERCDTFFPEIDFTQWHEIACEEHTGHTFLTYTRKN